MIGAIVYNEGMGGLATSYGGEAVDFLGSYVVARAFFFGPAALDALIVNLRNPLASLNT